MLVFQRTTQAADDIHLGHPLQAGYHFGSKFLPFDAGSCQERLTFRRQASDTLSDHGFHPRWQEFPIQIRSFNPLAGFILHQIAALGQPRSNSTVNRAFPSVCWKSISRKPKSRRFGWVLI